MGNLPDFDEKPACFGEKRMTKILGAKGQLLWDSSAGMLDFAPKSQEDFDAIRAETPYALALFHEGQMALRDAGAAMTQTLETFIPGALVDGSKANRFMIDHMFDKLYDATVFMQRALDFLNGFFEANPEARMQREVRRREIEECRRENEECHKQNEN